MHWPYMECPCKTHFWGQHFPKHLEGNWVVNPQVSQNFLQNFIYLTLYNLTYNRYTLLYTKYYTYMYAKMRRYLICLHIIWKGRTGRVNGASFLCDVEPVNLCHVTSPNFFLPGLPTLTSYLGSTGRHPLGNTLLIAPKKGPWAQNTSNMDVFCAWCVWKGIKHKNTHIGCFWAQKRVRHWCTFVLSMCWAWNHPCWVASVLAKHKHIHQYGVFMLGVCGPASLGWRWRGLWWWPINWQQM